MTLRQTIDTQLAPTVALAPDLVSIIVGMNDLIRPRLDFDRFSTDLDTLLSGLAATGAVVLTATLPTPGAGAPLPPLLRRRLIDRLHRGNAIIRRAATDHGAYFLDLAGLPPTGADSWSADRLHPGPAAHQLIADAFVALLDAAGAGTAPANPGTAPANPGTAPANPGTARANPVAAPANPVAGSASPVHVIARPTLREQARWLRRYLLPWLLRRARGRSSADGIVAKLPTYRAIPGPM